MKKKKTLVEKFKDQPQPVKLMALIALLWVYPFIESMVIGAGGFVDLSIVSNILMGISVIPFGYMAWVFGIKPVIYWISLLFKKKK